MKWIKTLSILTILCLTVEVQAVTMTFSDFSSTSDLTLNGSTATISTSDGIVLRLTEAKGGQSGSAFSTQTVNAANFSTFFRFRITDPGGHIFDCNTEAGADGLVFVIQSVASDIGGSGQGIGYAGIATSIGVEFDTWCNAGNNDPSSNHLAINTNGSVAHADPVNDTLIITPDFDDGNIWYAWIDYNGSTLEIRISQNSSRPSQASLQKDVDIPNLLGQNDAYIGFTSGTGSDWGNHDILYWEYKDSYDPIVTIPGCDNEYQAGYNAGRQACIDDPDSCGLGGGSITINSDLSFTLPSAIYSNPLTGALNLWVDFKYFGEQDGKLLWELNDVRIK